MRAVFILMLGIINLYAGIFGSSDIWDAPAKEAAQQQTIYTTFSSCASDINAIIRHGAYEKKQGFFKNIVDVEKRIEQASIEQKQKEQLKEDIKKYRIICQSCIKTMQNDAPKLASQYKTLIESLQKFDSMVNSTGFPPLLKEWHKLSRIKRDYIKKPSAQTEKEFYRTLELVTITVRELYLEDEMEEPMLGFLKNYKEYFSSLATSYKNIAYDNVNDLRPLAYKIKSQIQLNIPNNL